MLSVRQDNAYKVRVMLKRIPVFILPLLILLSGCGGISATPPLSTATGAPAALTTNPSAVRESGLYQGSSTGAPGVCVANTPCALETATAVTPALPRSAPTFAELPTEPAVCLAGQVEQQVIQSEELHRGMVVRVYLPPCYDPRRSPGYPVVYLLHGQSMDASAWESFGVVDAANRLMASGDVLPFLIVMPQEEYYLQEVHDSGFGKAVVNELIPWVDAGYNTCAGRACRAIGGISRGATWAMMLGLENPRLFAVIGAHSLPSPPMSSSRLRTLLEAAPDGPPALRIDIGSEDPYYSDAARFEASLKLLGVPHEWLVEEGTHNAAYWKAHVEEYVRWYGSVLGE